jgi:hypothetical protein
MCGTGYLVMLNWLISPQSVTGTRCTGGCSLNGRCVGYLVVVIFNMLLRLFILYVRAYISFAYTTDTVYFSVVVFGGSPSSYETG